METIKIKKGQPVPRPSIFSGRSIYPWADMKNGDSFSVPKKMRASTASSGARYCSMKRPNMKIVTRITSSTEVTVWMLKK